MDDKRRVKVKIAGRSYPLSIPSGQEEILREAEKMINDKIESYRKVYLDKDNQDLLSMATLQFLMKSLQDKSTGGIESFVGQLVDIEHRLDLISDKL